jgi:hypothetical protein
MKNTSFASPIAITLTIGLAMLAAPMKIEAQEKSADRFDISLSHPVTIGNKVLQPGNYSLEPVNIAGGDAPVLSISLVKPDNGLKYETAAMVSPKLEKFNYVQPETRVVLRQIGNSYYFARIWVKGQSYGYNFPLPKGVKGPGTEVQ